MSLSDLTTSQLTEKYQKDLELSTGLNLKISFTHNRSTMVRVHWQKDLIKVSLHQMFLNAPQEVYLSLISYLQRKEKKLSPKIRAYIEENMRLLDYTSRVSPERLVTQGKVYDLETIYKEINERYFHSSLKLNITWFGAISSRSRRRVTLGMYQETLKLIKIHRLLDSDSFPYHVVAFITYHEMLHHTCPSFFDENGIHRIHHKAFKEEEKKFQDFTQASKWIKDHQHLLLGKNYGWS